MGLSWSKDRRRTLSRLAATDGMERARLVAELDGGQLYRPEQSKEEMRAETAALVEEYRGKIKRLPTFVPLKCVCGHRGRAMVKPGRKPRFRCSKCGALSL